MIWIAPSEKDTDFAARISSLAPSEGERAGVRGDSDFSDWQPFIIYRCVVGSQAFGLSGDDSDVDRRGIYLPPAALHWSLYGVPEQIENNDTGRDALPRVRDRGGAAARPTTPEIPRHGPQSQSEPWELRIPKCECRMKTHE